MNVIHEGQRLLFGVLLDPLGRFGPRVALVLVSVVSGVVLMAIFRLASNPRAIRRARNRVQAQLLAVRLYRHDIGTVVRAQGALLRNLGGYMGRMVVPFLVLLVPFGALFAQLDARYGSRALRPGESAIVRIEAPDRGGTDWRLETDGGATVEVGPVRVPARGEVVWRVRAAEPGTHPLRFRNGTTELVHSLVVGTELEGATSRRGRAGPESLAFAAAAPPLSPDVGATLVEVEYPWLPLGFFGTEWSWITVFLVVSIVTALALRRRLGVEL